MTDTYTLNKPLRVVDISSKFTGMWYVETKENPFMHLSVKGEILNCLDINININDLYFKSKHAAEIAAEAYILNEIANLVTDDKVTGDVEQQTMEF